MGSKTHRHCAHYRWNLTAAVCQRPGRPAPSPGVRGSTTSIRDNSCNFLPHRTASAAQSVQNEACSAACRRHIYSSDLESRAKTQRHGPSVRVRHIAVNAMGATHFAAVERRTTFEPVPNVQEQPGTSKEQTSELKSLMRIPYTVFC